jgi:hypothetical protein
MHDLHAGGKVKGVVERAVPASTKTMPGDLAARDLDRGGPRVTGETVRRGEAADVCRVPRILAASTSLMPKMLVRVVPEACGVEKLDRRSDAMKERASAPVFRA